MEFHDNESEERLEELDNALSVMSSSATYIPAELVFLRMSEWRVKRGLSGDHVNEQSYVMDRLVEDGLIVNRPRTLPVIEGLKPSQLEIRLLYKGRQVLEKGGYRKLYKDFKWNNKTRFAKRTMIVLHATVTAWLAFEALNKSSVESETVFKVITSEKEIEKIKNKTIDLENIVLSLQSELAQSKAVLASDTTQKKK